MLHFSNSKSNKDFIGGDENTDGTSVYDFHQSFIELTLGTPDFHKGNSKKRSDLFKSMTQYISDDPPQIEN